MAAALYLRDHDFPKTYSTIAARFFFALGKEVTDKESISS
jgi:hypothetical protein